LGLARAASAAGAVIHEGTRAETIDFEQGVVTTARGRVTAAHVLVACNGYLGRLVPAIAPNIMPINSYIVATEPLGNMARTLIPGDVAVADTRFVVNYYRLSADGRMLYGGRESYTAALLGDFEAGVRTRMLSVFPQLKDARIDYAWGGTLAITPNRLPHVGRLGQRGFFAHGFSGHGVALAGLTGKLMAEAVAGTIERFDVFAGLDVPRFPGGTLLRGPLRMLAMLYGRLRDAL
jgi:gamma-glutamylputrescine oxidase